MKDLLLLRFRAERRMYWFKWYIFLLFSGVTFRTSLSKVISGTIFDLITSTMLVRTSKVKNS